MSAKLYQFVLPNHDNKGVPYDHRLEQFESLALRYAGGLTRVAVAALGKWRDQDAMDCNEGSQVDYEDSVRIYQIACEPAVLSQLIDAAFALFSDQLSLYVAEIGRAYLIDRPRDVEAMDAPDLTKEESQRNLHNVGPSGAENVAAVSLYPNA